jgi:folylpolyglutamate synthase/dihydropteroate synthase
LTICDTGHNQAGLEYVFSQLNSIDKHKHIILGFVNDKKIDEVMKILPEILSSILPNLPSTEEDILKIMKIY